MGYLLTSKVEQYMFCITVLYSAVVERCLENKHQPSKTETHTVHTHTHTYTHTHARTHTHTHTPLALFTVVRSWSLESLTHITPLKVLLIILPFLYKVKGRTSTLVKTEPQLVIRMFIW